MCPRCWPPATCWSGLERYPTSPARSSRQPRWTDRFRLSRPLMVVTEALPLQPLGTSVVLRRLLEHFAGDEIVLLACNPDPHQRLKSPAFHYPTVTIASLSSYIRGQRYWRLGSF